jgi:hypothetical protein
MPCVGEGEGEQGGCEVGMPQGAWDAPRSDAGCQQRGADACRRVWLATPVVAIPARGVAVRQAPWTLERRRGEAAGGPGM